MPPAFLPRSPRLSPSRAHLVLVLAVAVLAVSTSSLLVRYAESPPLTIALWRMVMAAVVHTVIWRRREHRAAPLPRRSLGLLALAGLALAVHFATWITSLHYTSIAASTVLVNMQPVFAVCLAALFLRERTHAGRLVGIGLACVGALGVFLDAGPDTGQTFGNLLALAGAAAAAAYYVVGRQLRQVLSVWAYTARVYSVAAVTLLAIALAIGAPLLPTTNADWGLFVAMALVPSLLGHTLLNWTLRWLPAPVTNAAALGEPLFAAILAYLCFAEVPGLGTILGGGVTLLGIALALRPVPTARS